MLIHGILTSRSPKRSESALLKSRIVILLNHLDAISQELEFRHLMAAASKFAPNLSIANQLFLFVSKR